MPVKNDVRKDLFDQVRELLRSGDMTSAAEKFEALYKVEFPAEVAVKLTVNSKDTPEVQARKLMKEPEAWLSRKGYMGGNEKYPREETVELFSSIPLTHEMLVQFHNTPNTPKYMYSLLFSHPNWDETWLRQRMADAIRGRRFFTYYMMGSRNYPLVREFIRQTKSGYASWDMREGYGYLYHHADAETLALLVEWHEFASALSSPRFSVEKAVMYAENYKSIKNWDLKRCLLASSSLPDESKLKVWETAEVADIREFADIIVTWDAAPGWLLEFTYNEVKNRPTIRNGLAIHPNASITLLRKLVKSKDPKTFEAATRQLEQKMANRVR